MTREQWLKKRGERIGGSNISTILGLNPYQSPYDLWLRLTKREQPPVENNNMIAGRFLEHAIADWFDYVTPHHVVKASAGNILYEHPEYPFLVASPDRKVFLNGSRKKEDTALMEIKTTGMNVDPDEVPFYWFLQPTYYCGMLGYEKFIVLWYDRHRNNIDYKLYDFDKSIYDTLIEQAVYFWNEYVVKDIPPPAVNASDIEKLYPQSEEGKSLIATDDILDIYSSAIHAYRLKNKYYQEYKELSDKIKVIMKDAETLLSPNMERLFTYKTDKNNKRRFKIFEI